jgi:hypothetical protein
MNRTGLLVITVAVSLSCASVAAAARFCEHGGKKYAIFATRCEDGKHLRCVSKDTWKQIGTCK